MLCAQLCPALFDPMDCNPSGSSVRGISQARILEWLALSSSRTSSRPRDLTRVSSPALVGRFFTTTPPGKAKVELYDQQITGWKPYPSDSSAPWRLFPSPTEQAICCLNGSKIHLEHSPLPLYCYSRIHSLLLLLFKIKVSGLP